MVTQAYFLVCFCFIFAAFASREGGLTTFLSDGWEGSTPRYSRYLLISRSLTGYPPWAVLSLPLLYGYGLRDNGRLESD